MIVHGVVISNDVHIVASNAEEFYNGKSPLAGRGAPQALNAVIVETANNGALRINPSLGRPLATEDQDEKIREPWQIQRLGWGGAILVQERMMETAEQ